MDRGPRDHFTGRHYDARHATGPIPFLNPTVRYLSLTPEPKPGRHEGDTTGTEAEVGAVAPGKAKRLRVRIPAGGAAGIYHVWRSRDNRKGRHAALVTSAAVTAAEGEGGAAAAAVVDVPRPTDTLGASLRGIWKMFVRYPIWDVSYDVAIVFTLGSVIWVVNGFFVWLPLVAPSTTFNGESTMAAGVLAFVGATVFEFGAILAMLEAVNENRGDCFGWALEEAWENSRLNLRTAHDDDCRHHHPEKRALLSRMMRSSESVHDHDHDHDDQDQDEQKPSGGRYWSWFPTWYELRTHYVRELGFLACAAQLFGATVFWISGLTGLPPIYNALTEPAGLDGAYWAPQVVGGAGFIVSSLLFTVEVQPRWYVPAWGTLGWHIGVWNLVGAVGFTLCGALGFAFAPDAAGVEYASGLATWIGSWAFLIGSIIQWYESLSKYPIWIGDAPSSVLSDVNGSGNGNGNGTRADQ